jgi:diguanylate cyclase (GGDEF)-like protein/PAS domain S-box-containing protein
MRSFSTAMAPARSKDSSMAVAEKTYRQLLEAAPDALIVIDAAGKILLMNGQAETQFGYSRDELESQPIESIIPEGLSRHVLALASPQAAEPLPQHKRKGVELKARRKDGSAFPIESTLSPVPTSAGILVTVSVRDITARKRAEALMLGKMQELNRAQVTLNCIGDAVVCTDVDANITFMNAAAESATGWSLKEAVGRPIAEILRTTEPTGNDSTGNTATLAILENCAQLVPTKCKLVHRDGREIRIENSVAPINDANGEVSGAVVVFRDTSAAEAMSRQIAHAASHDCLTGLPNSRLLKRRIEKAISVARKNGGRIAVLFLDLDGFKYINDSLGHPIGDKLLQSVASRLLACIRKCDTVSRQGGDEFVVLLSYLWHPKDPVVLARRLLRAVAEVHLAEKHSLHVTTSIGVSLYPEDGCDAETLIKNADTAMYQAKENGRQGFQFFQRAMNARAVERQSIAEALRHALQHDAFLLHYQPKVNTRTGEIAGAEALIRWAHSSRGMLLPAQFIPIAEESGLILQIGRWVLRRACAQARAWADVGLPVPVAVNVSAMEFSNDDFVRDLFAILREMRVDPSMLELELTESVFMKHPESAADSLRTLRKAGMRVAVDDFGTGYSCLSYLRTLPIDALKIDRSFVRQIANGEDDSSIVTAIINMARSLHLQVVAEGVETKEQLEALRAHNCELVQGYYFSPAVPPEQFATLLKRSGERKQGAVAFRQACREVG